MTYTQGMIEVSKNHQFALQVITEFLAARLSRREAAELLGIQKRSVSRIAARIRKRGALGLVHGNQKRKPVNRTPEAFQAMIMRLMESRYFDCNLTHALWSF